MRNGLIFVILAAFCVDLSTQQETNVTADSFRSRDGKALSVFQVVRFPNTLCVGSSSLNGTCYTSSECTNKGGTSSGSCASGFGVCCTFTLGCGSKIAENTTYFQSSSTTVPGGQCSVTICKCSSDICQLRLDFSTFVITGPSTSTVSTGFQTAGSGTNTAGLATSAATQCLTDTFSVTGSPGGNPPVICGTNTGYHMYAEASDGCNTLDFQLGNVAIGTTLATRQWNIRITQISCFDANKAPAGCTQYFYGSSTGTINSYNWAATTPVQLANQNQRICIRRERSYCRTCYSPTTITDFQISGKATKGFITGTKCCGYGTDGKDTKGYDCVIIPGAAKFTSPYTAINGVQNFAFCGGRFMITDTTAGTGKTVCTSQIPFRFDFITDSYTTSTANVYYRGFRLVYWQQTC